MSNPNKEKAPIVVQITSEMANWMHPQTNERKHLMLARAEAAKQRYHRQKRASARPRRKNKRIALIYGKPTTLGSVNIVVKTTKSIPRQKVLGHLIQTSDDRFHRVDK